MRARIFAPDDDDTMDAKITSAYNQREPVLFHSWDLNPLIWQYDMVKLEEPAYNDDCWKEITSATKEDPLGKVKQACGYPTQDIHKGVYGGLLDEAPEVVAFLRNMFIGTKRLQELSVYIENANNPAPNEIAIYYFRTYEAEWTSWVPEDIATRVKAALP